jgi:hypothetical protein
MTDDSSATRRRYLVAASAVLGLGAGCLEGAGSAGSSPTATRTQSATDTGTASPETDGAVTVTRSRTSARSPTDWERTLTVSTATGRVTEALVCGDDTRSDTASLSDAELAPFRDLDESSVADLASRYDCAERCPTDIPPTTITVTTPDTERTATVEAGAETPPVLGRLTDALETASQHVSTDGCSPPTETR